MSYVVDSSGNRLITSSDDYVIVGVAEVLPEAPAAPVAAGGGGITVRWGRGRWPRRPWPWSLPAAIRVRWPWRKPDEPEVPTAKPIPTGPPTVVPEGSPLPPAVPWTAGIGAALVVPASKAALDDEDLETLIMLDAA